MALRQANQYSTEFILAGTTPALASVGVSFGFDASVIRVLNYAGVPLHVSLRSTGLATTDDPEIAQGEMFQLSGILVSGLSLTTTSATTSTAGNGQRVVVSAWSGF